MKGRARAVLVVPLGLCMIIMMVMSEVSIIQVLQRKDCDSMPYLVQLPSPFLQGSMLEERRTEIEGE